MSPLPMMVTGKQSPCPYLDPQAFNHIFSPFPTDGVRGREWLGEHLAASPGQSSTDSKPDQCRNHFVPLWI